MVNNYNDVVERQNLRQKIELAKRLGFHDDVAYWTAQLEATNNNEEGK